jgi:aryl carrier-like protein
MGEVGLECEPETGPAIGRGIDNVSVYVLDARGVLSPVGVAGEIWIGGESLARGYLGEAEQTAERFLPDGVSGARGGRLYGTGDLGRYLWNGEIEFLGRKDQQVKIRGYRIELGEIEAALCCHPSVNESVVVVHETAQSEKRLVGYVVCDQTAMPSATEIRSYLKEHLPDYMTPKVIVQLDALPLTPNGKIDRRMLPEPPASQPSDGSPSVTPRTDIEWLICQIWQSVLNVDRIGINDNFFDLGGHSLTMVKVYDRLRKSMPDDPVMGNLQLVMLFEHPTVGALAAHLSRASQTGVEVGKLQRRALDQHAALRRQKMILGAEVEMLNGSVSHSDC